MRFSLSRSLMRHVRGGIFALASALMIIAAAGCGSADASPDTTALIYGEGPAPTAETIGQAKRLDVDYVHLLNRSRSGDREALVSLLRHSRIFSGAALANHGTILAALLRRVGDAVFAEALAAITAADRAAVAIALGCGMLPADGITANSQGERSLIAEALFAQKFPLTYAALFPVPERVRYFVALARQGRDDRAAGAPPIHEEIAALGDEAAPTLLEMLSDKHPTRVRIEPPRDNDRFFSVIYLKADEGGETASVAEFAYFCLCRLREPAEGTYEQYEEYWRAVLREVRDGDGAISDAAIDACKKWWQKRTLPDNKPLRQSPASLPTGARHPNR